MNIKKENGITLLSLSLMLIILILIAGIVISTGLDGANSVDKSKEAGMLTEKQSIIDAIIVDIENLRVKRLLSNQGIGDSDILTLMQEFVNKKGEIIDLNNNTKNLTFENGKIKSNKGFEITLEEVKAQCQI